MVELRDVEAAREAIAGRLHRTPTFRSATLGERVFLKAELFQKTGSFKPRGVLNNLAALTPEERERGVIGISAGNHAQALAWGAASEGLDALLVMWQGASEAKISPTRGYGAQVRRRSPPPAATARRSTSTRAARRRRSRASTSWSSRRGVRRCIRLTTRARLRARGRSGSSCSRTFPTPTWSSCPSAAAA